MYQPHWFKIWLFRHDLELTAFNHGFSPELPEIRQLFDRADTIVRNEAERVVLAKLDPNRGVRRPPVVDHLHIDVGSAWDGLRPWHIAQLHVPRLDRRLTGFVIDKFGTHVMGDDEQPLVTFRCASATTPDGRRFAKMIFEALTGDEIEGFDVRAFSNTARITISASRGEWHVVAAEGVKRI